MAVGGREVSGDPRQQGLVKKRAEEVGLHLTQKEEGWHLEVSRVNWGRELCVHPREAEESARTRGLGAKGFLE